MSRPTCARRQARCCLVSDLLATGAKVGPTSWRQSWTKGLRDSHFPRELGAQYAARGSLWTVGQAMLGRVSRSREPTRLCAKSCREPGGRDTLPSHLPALPWPWRATEAEIDRDLACLTNRLFDIIGSRAIESLRGAEQLGDAYPQSLCRGRKSPRRPRRRGISLALAIPG